MPSLDHMPRSKIFLPIARTKRGVVHVLMQFTQIYEIIGKEKFHVCVINDAARIRINIAKLRHLLQNLHNMNEITVPVILRKFEYVAEMAKLSVDEETNALYLAFLAVSANQKLHHRMPEDDAS